ncbi:tRNA (cytidine(34)-2'-O)-methyltransferase [Anaerobiospirillum thomasii]|uniref:tRNA (cytidine(34)-2'-O)-methyltransferase n=1 Tax=Anaerobiospirillum thomasii TaxID=179995 RepID=UPI000D968285|nr:tRNA (cytidine(34)-2'-O)-methyltransferase [Anaerobiospirillum thomasii]SPT68560.1 tRNA (cytidine(34)-2'-O)-methyltransferase [Anaerobiospirillum thomasii]
MIQIVLYRPQMPENAGNIIRLSANFGLKLHIVGPLDFFLDNKRMLRAGLDYHQIANMVSHTSFESFMQNCSPKRLIAATTKGSVLPSSFKFEDEGDFLIFGRETSGLPDEVMTLIDSSCRLKIPMMAQSRCLNVANSVAILAYEALRQQDFKGMQL